MPLTTKEIGTVNIAGAGLAEINREIVEESEELYDLVFTTMLETFTVPLTAEEERNILENIDEVFLKKLMEEDPEQARQMLREMRRLEIGLD